MCDQLRERYLAALQGGYQTATTDLIAYYAREFVNGKCVILARTSRMHTTQHRQREEISPSGKRKAGEEDLGESLSARETVELIRQTIKGELQVVSEVKAAMDHVKQRIDCVEAEVTKQMGGTIQILNKITDKQDTQGKHIAQLRDDQEGLVNRIELLEGKMASFSPAVSTASTEGGEKTPAIIMGGWPEDQQASATLEKAKEMVRRLRININMEHAFVPGVRRGYAIVPYGPQGGETPEQMRTRIRESLTKAKEANVKLGTRASGEAQNFWMSISQSPERRRRAHFGKGREQVTLGSGVAIGDGVV